MIKLATDALDEIRREVWNEARRQGHAQEAKELKGSRAGQLQAGDQAARCVDRLGQTLSPSTVRQLARTITDQRPGIEAAIKHGLSNARTEQVNTQLRVIARRAYGFHTPKP